MVARYNPCGRVVDIGQDAYTTTARLYPDSDRTFTIRWYEALPDAKVLPFPSALNNLGLAGDQTDWYPTAVGEVFGSQYTQQRPNQNPLALGDHYCGTEQDFGGEGEIDEDSPPVEYREDGLPVCCGEQFEARGGLGLGGIATVDTPIIVLARVVSSTGTPPVHTCVRMTRDTSNDVIEYTPLTEYTQVLNPDSFEYVAGTLIQIYEIDDWPGFFWGELITYFDSTDTVQLQKEDDGRVIANAVTQMSIDQDSGGIKLKNDEVAPPLNHYYGTDDSVPVPAYKPLSGGVITILNDPTTVDLLLALLFGGTNAFGIAILNLGGGIFIAGVDLTPAATTEETLVNSSAISVTDAASLISTQRQTTYTNSFNAAGLIIDRTAGGPVDNTSHVDYDGTETIRVVGSAASSSLTFSAIYQDSIDADTFGLRLVGDVLDPGPGFAYSTDGSGDKGWYPYDGVWIENVGGVIAHIGPASAGHTTIAYPTQLVFDARGHVVSGTAGSTPVTAITTTDQTGGPLTGSVDLNGGSGIQLTVSGSTITIALSGGGVGPAPTSAPALTATAGNTQVSLSWTTVTGATSYQLYRGGTLIDTTTGTAFLDTGLTNGVTYSYVVNGVNNLALGPGGTASATPMAPPATSASTTGTTGALVINLPTNVSGDLLVVGIAADNGPSIGGPGGIWTARNAEAGSNTELAVFSAVSTGGLTSVTFPTAGQNHWRSICLNFGSKTWFNGVGNQGFSGTTATASALTISGSGNINANFYDAEVITTTITANGGSPIANGWLCCDLQAVSGTTTGPHTATLSVGGAWNAVTCVVH